MNCQKIKYSESKNELQSRIDEHLNYLYTFYINSRKSSFLYDNLDNPKTQEEKDIMWKDHILNEIKFLLIKNYCHPSNFLKLENSGFPGYLG